MSSLLDYVRRLVPSFKKNSVLSGIETTRHGLVENALPVYTTAMERFASSKISSKESKDWVTEFDKRVGGGGPIGVTLGVLQNTVQILDHLSVEGKKVFSDVEANVGLSYEKATYIRLLEAAEFVSEYSLKWLNMITIFETANVDDHTSVKGNLTPLEMKYLTENYDDYLSALVVLSKTVKDIEKGVKGLPDAIITELTESTFPNTLGQGKIDPFNMRQFSAAVNPFYFFGLMVVEYQAKVYKRKKALKELLELRLLNLKRIQEKNPDAGLQKDIEITAERVGDLDDEIRRKEKEWFHD